MQRRDDGDFVATIADSWDIAGNANGGYLLAILGAAMREASGRPDPLTVTAHFLAPGKPGSAELQVSVVKQGRQLVTVSGMAVQNGRPILQAIGTFGDLDSMAEEVSLTSLVRPTIAPLDRCLDRQGAAAKVDVGIVHKVLVALDPRDSGFSVGQPSGRAEINGWFEFRDQRPLDSLALLLVCDVFPPAVFNVEIAPGWVPTVELTVHVRARPAPGPLQCRFATEVVQNGAINEDGVVWDSAGTVVAQSRQYALLPRGA